MDTAEIAETQTVPKNGGKLTPEQELYRRKYLLLKKKCGSMESDNKRLLNRIYQVRKAISRLSRERRGLTKRLGELKDTFRTIERTTPLEDHPMMHLLGFADPSTLGINSKVPVKPTIDPRTGFPVPTKAKVPSRSALARERNPPTATPRKRKAKESVKVEREKDPKAPKKPANAFLMFCQEKRHTAVHPIDPEKSKLESHAELTKQLAKEWNDLDGAQKKRYFAAYEKERVKYVEKVQQYSKDLESEITRAASLSSATLIPGTTSKETTPRSASPGLGKVPHGSAKEPPKVSPRKEVVRAPLLGTSGGVGGVRHEHEAHELDPYSFDGD